MNDQARMSFQPEASRMSEQPMREASCQAYLPENQSIFRSERGSAQGNEHLPSIQIIFEQGPPVGFARAQVGGYGSNESPYSRYERGFERDHSNYDRFNHKRFDHSSHGHREQLSINRSDCTGGANDPLERSAVPRDRSESNSLFSGHRDIAALLERLADLFRNGSSSRVMDERYSDYRAVMPQDSNTTNLRDNFTSTPPDSVAELTGLSNFPALPKLPGFDAVPSPIDVLRNGPKLPELPELPEPPRIAKPFELPTPPGFGGSFAVPELPLPKLPKVPELPIPELTDLPELPKLGPLPAPPSPFKFLNKLFG